VIFFENLKINRNFDGFFEKFESGIEFLNGQLLFYH